MRLLTEAAPQLGFCTEGCWMLKRVAADGVQFDKSVRMSSLPESAEELIICILTHDSSGSQFIANSHPAIYVLYYFDSVLLYYKMGERIVSAS